MPSGIEERGRVVNGREKVRIGALAEIFDPRSGSFAPTGSKTVARRQHQVVLLRDGRVLVTGGDDGISSSVASAVIYVPTAGRFSALDRPHEDTPLDGQTIVVLADGRVLFAGGQDGLGASSNAVTVFDANTNTFTGLPGMPVRGETPPDRCSLTGACCSPTAPTAQPASRPIGPWCSIPRRTPSGRQGRRR